MRFLSPLVKATLIKRYKRFLADVQMDNGDTITVYCPNTGTMLSCSAPGSSVGLSKSDNSNRKYPYTLEIVKANSTWVGVNTAQTNKLVIEAIEKSQIAEFQNVVSIQSEVKTSSHTRLDLKVNQEDSSILVEIKNCSLAVDGCAMFPDAVTARGTKHLQELIRLTKEDQRGCIFFLVQRIDADRFTPASHIDKIYSETLGKAVDAGVMLLVYQADVSLDGIDVVRQLPYSLG